MTLRDVLIVGEAPNRAGEGRRANTTLTGGRISRLHAGANALPRTNLLRSWPGPQGKGSAFPLALARPAAARLLRRTPSSVPLLFVGTRVAAAFGMQRASFEYLSWLELCFVDLRLSQRAVFAAEPWEAPRNAIRRVAVCPHPSGIVLWWNEPQHVQQAVDFFRAMLG